MMKGERSQSVGWGRLWRRRFAIFVGIGALVLSCTENPFFDDNAVPVQNRWITGHVRLSDGADATGVAYWLEGYDIKGFTGPKGYFTLQLPPGGSLPVGSEDGVFLLYFYVGNYRCNSAKIVVLNGSIASNQGDVGLNGQIVEPIELKKWVEIETLVNATQVDLSDTVFCQIRVTPRVSGEKIRFFTHARQGELFASYLCALDDMSQPPLEYANSNSAISVYTIRDTSVTFNHFIALAPRQISAKQYRVVPCIHLIQTDLPSGFMAHYGHVTFSFTPSFVEIPYRRQGGEFEIVTAERDE